MKRNMRLGGILCALELSETGFWTGVLRDGQAGPRHDVDGEGDTPNELETPES